MDMILNMDIDEMVKREWIIVDTLRCCKMDMDQLSKRKSNIVDMMLNMYMDMEECHIMEWLSFINLCILS